MQVAESRMTVSLTPEAPVPGSLGLLTQLLADAGPALG
jgi:hypothetical protein